VELTTECAFLLNFVAMPSIIAKIALAIPGTQPAESIRSILLRGWGLTNFSVYMGFISPFIFMIFYTVMTVVMLKVRK